MSRHAVDVQSFEVSLDFNHSLMIPVLDPFQSTESDVEILFNYQLTLNDPRHKRKIDLHCMKRVTIREKKDCRRHNDDVEHAKLTLHF